MWRVTVVVGILCCVSPAGQVQGEVLSEDLDPSFVELTLSQAIDIALAQHPTMRMREARVAASRQRVRQEIAGALPRGSYTYDYSRRRLPLTEAVGGAQLGDDPRERNIHQIFNYNSTSFTVSQVLWDFGRVRAAIRSARASVDASAADFELTRQTVIFNTKHAYYTVLSHQQVLQVAEETVQQNRKHLEEARARYQTGFAPRFDITRAEVEVSDAELVLLDARHDVALARETLRTALGIKGPFLFVLADNLDRRVVSLDDEGLVAKAYANRPELRGIQAQRRGTAEQVVALQKRYLPSISGTARYNWTGRAYPLQEGWRWGVTLTVPLLDSFLTAAQVGEARAQMSELEAQEEEQRQQIVLEIRQGYLDLRYADQSIDVSAQAVRGARESLDLAQGRYSAGLGSIIELTDAQVALTSARAKNIQALYAYQTAVAQLEKAVGQPLE